MAVTAAIAAVVAAGATSGYQAKRGHDAQVKAKHEAYAQTQAQSALAAEQQQKEERSKFDQANLTARARQRALATSFGTADAGAAQGGNPGATLGAIGTAGARQSSLLGY